MAQVKLLIPTTTGDDHLMRMEVNPVGYLDEAHPHAKPEWVLEYIEVKECYVVNYRNRKQERKIDYNKITCIDKKKVEELIEAELIRQSKEV